MAATPARTMPKPIRATVLRKERLTPHMIRVVLGGAGLADFTAGEFTNHYVKLLFPRPEVDYPDPFDLEAIRAEMPRDQWPTTRTYTVRSWNPETRELAIDFVYHGDKGLAGPWAARVRPGEDILFFGPGGSYAPSADADWHLLVGDESALPAIGAALERIPADARAWVFAEVAGPEEEQNLPAPAGAEIVWLHRSGGRVGDALVRSVRELDFPKGNVHAFVHGEANLVKELRRHLRIERGVRLEQLSISGYWRLGRNEDGWQSTKKDWNREIDEAEAAELGTP